MSTALVTGGTGFAGSALVELLRSRDWQVTTLSRAAAPGDHWVADVSDADAVGKAVDAVRPDVVFHLAGLSPQKAAGDHTAVITTSVAGTLAVCTALARFVAHRGPSGGTNGPQTRLVVAGSSAVYGEVEGAVEGLVREETRCAPGTVYGLAKLAGEQTAAAFAAGGLDVVLVRAFNHIGPGEPPNTVAGAFARRVAAVRAGAAQTVAAADLEAVRDFTDVRDISRGYLAAAEHGTAGRVYQLCSGRPHTVGDVLDGLLGLAGLDRSVVRIDSGIPAAPIRYQVGSPERAAAELGWRAELELATSLADLFDGVFPVVRSQ